MFPDPTSRWKPFVSSIDGIKSPFVLDYGIWKGEIRLLIWGNRDDHEHWFGASADCIISFSVEEYLYSVSGHGDGPLTYDGTVYIKEAEFSQLLNVVTSHWEWDSLNHFAFIGTEYCVEIISTGKLFICDFGNEEDATKWAKDRESQRNTLG